MRHLFAFAGVLSFGTGAYADCQPQDDVLAALRCIDGLTAEEVVPSTVPGYRQFELGFSQAVQHGNPKSEQFSQRLVLLHAGWDDPMVLQTSGYAIFGVGLSRLARTFGANQIQVEHRYFAGSTPAALDWRHLTIEESAADFHRVTVAFKQLYRHRWVGTGASKGGMTSTYHRRYFPDDLDGTVADVAPLSFSMDDERYVTFVDQVGGEELAACRAKLAAFQQTLLDRRDIFMSRVEGEFSRLGSASVAYEHAVIETPFAFWQYGNPADPDHGCDRVPSAEATDDEVWEFAAAVNGISGYSDEAFTTFGSYYFQAGTQLGGPGARLDHLNGRQHEYSLGQYMPPGVRYQYSNAAMRDVERWVRTEATGIMFVYGELDPWTAAAYPQGENSDMHWYMAPGANHGAKFHLLADEDRSAALATLAIWFDRQPVVDETEAGAPTLDDLELAAKSQLRLP